jgi:hypothetical protein
MWAQLNKPCNLITSNTAGLPTETHPAADTNAADQGACDALQSLYGVSGISHPSATSSDSTLAMSFSVNGIVMWSEPRSVWNRCGRCSFARRQNGRAIRAEINGR